MQRLTNYFDYCDFTECRHYDKELAKNDSCNFIHSSRERCFEYAVYNKLREYEDLEEQGLLLKKEDAVDEGYLYDWYIHSVSDNEPVWTEAHLDELFNDFILIPKAEAEKALAKMKGE